MGKNGSGSAQIPGSGSKSGGPGGLLRHPIVDLVPDFVDRVRRSGGEAPARANSALPGPGKVEFDERAADTPAVEPAADGPVRGDSGFDLVSGHDPAENGPLEEPGVLGTADADPGVGGFLHARIVAHNLWGCQPRARGREILCNEAPAKRRATTRGWGVAGHTLRVFRSRHPPPPLRRRPRGRTSSRNTRLPLPHESGQLLPENAGFMGPCYGAIKPITSHYQQHVNYGSSSTTSASTTGVNPCAACPGPSRPTFTTT